jgi:tRNA threonylcarbamoyladenosine biosynthesis protein TsaE
VISPVTVSLPTANDTWDLGRRIAAAIRPGDVVVLTGPLGAGKTVLAQGIGAGLGVLSGVISPTFVLARVHREGRLPFVHVDAYRLAGFAELDDLDLDSDVADSVTVIEWGEGLADRLASEHLHVLIDRSGLDERRTAVLHANGAGWLRRLDEINR